MRETHDKKKTVSPAVKKRQMHAEAPEETWKHTSVHTSQQANKNKQTNGSGHEIKHAIT